MPVAAKNTDINLVLIRVTAVVLFVMATLIAVGTYGLSGLFSEQIRDLFHTVYMWFEYFFRAATVFLGAFLTYRFVKKTRGEAGVNRKATLIGFSLSSFVFLVIWPLATGYWHMYYVMMPFPWSTLPLQLADSGTFFAEEIPGYRGIDSVTFLLWGYMIFQAIVLAGTVFLGRKWQCSMVCVMNGCHAETLGEGLPFIVHNRRPDSKQISPGSRRFLRVLQAVLFAVNLLLILFWSILLAGGRSPVSRDLLVQFELIKYIALELTMLMLLWFIIGGRGYCYYCPAGFAVGIVSYLCGQRIETGLTHCTACGLCNDQCKLSIDIRAMAVKKRPVRSLHCVGCGLCADACPTGNLRYTTHLLSLIGKREG